MPLFDHYIARCLVVARVGCGYPWIVKGYCIQLDQHGRSREDRLVATMSWIDHPRPKIAREQSSCGELDETACSLQSCVQLNADNITRPGLDDTASHYTAPIPTLLTLLFAMSPRVVDVFDSCDGCMAERFSKPARGALDWDGLVGPPAIVLFVGRICRR